MSITLTREEAQQVLNWIDRNGEVVFAGGGLSAVLSMNLIAGTLRARLSASEPEEKKYTEESCPVCGYYCLGKGGVNCIDKPKLCGINNTPPQREWQGLTDEDKKQIQMEAGNKSEMTAFEYALRVGEFTEAKLKEKNHV